MGSGGILAPEPRFYSRHLAGAVPEGDCLLRKYRADFNESIIKPVFLYWSALTISSLAYRFFRLSHSLQQAESLQVSTGRESVATRIPIPPSTSNGPSDCCLIRGYFLPRLLLIRRSRGFQINQLKHAKRYRQHLPIRDEGKYSTWRAKIGGPSVNL
jgi:hypothetical protein